MCGIIGEAGLFFQSMKKGGITREVGIKEKLEY